MRVRLADAAQVKVLKRDIIAQGGWSGDRGPVLRIGLDVQVWLEPNECGNRGRCDMDLDENRIWLVAMDLHLCVLSFQLALRT